MRVFWHHDFKICECESGTLKKLLRDKLRWREPAGDYRGHWTAQDKWELQAAPTNPSSCQNINKVIPKIHLLKLVTDELFWDFIKR